MRIPPQPFMRPRKTRGAVLLTRPSGAPAEASLRRLAALGWTAIAAPLTFMEPIPRPEAARGDLAGAQALIFTSAEGVRRFAALTGEGRGRPVHAVGAATAAAARAAGFAQVEEGGGEVGALTRHLLARLDLGRGPILHFGAESPAGDLGGALRAAGASFSHVALYRAARVAALPEAAAESLRRGEIRAVLLYAPSAARAFAALAAGADLRGAAGIAISAAAAEPLKGLGFRRVVHGARPDEAHLLGALLAHG